MALIRLVGLKGLQEEGRGRGLYECQHVCVCACVYVSNNRADVTNQHPGLDRLFP